MWVHWHAPALSGLIRHRLILLLSSWRSYKNRTNMLQTNFRSSSQCRFLEPYFSSPSSSLFFDCLDLNPQTTITLMHYRNAYCFSKVRGLDFYLMARGSLGAQIRGSPTAGNGASTSPAATTTLETTSSSGFRWRSRPQCWRGVWSSLGIRCRPESWGIRWWRYGGRRIIFWRRCLSPAGFLFRYGRKSSVVVRNLRVEAGVVRRILVCPFMAGPNWPVS